MVSVGDRLELPLTLAEFSEALRRMPTNKSPGMDGLTVELYRVFWDILGPDLATVWAESLQGRVLPLSCRQAVLALLLKKGDLRDLRNWRPVSLLSTDYKIVGKAISLRLGSVLADVIHPDQTYTVPGCSIFDNLFLVRDLLELGRRDGLSFALLSLDQEKAFDRVDHGYLLSTLQALGFGSQFVSFFQVLYASAECLVRLNWTLTKPVSFGRGVQQGCPLSGQLYALAIEPFLCLLRRRLTRLVLREPELRLVLLAYADDVLQDPGDLARVEACQDIYSAASSARVNWVKSSGLAVGDWRQHAEQEIFERTEAAEGILEPQESEKLNFNQKCVQSPLLHQLWASAVLSCATGLEEVRVDEKTVSPLLALSEDKKTLAFSPKKAKTYPDCPERFDHWPNALGTKAFHKGTHAWRISVGKSCAYKLGISYGSLERKGPGSAARLGYNPFSWVFSRYDKEFCFSHNGHHQAVELVKCPIQVGVLLDLDGGEVLFYDPSACVILHSHREAFTAPIYPVFAVADQSVSLIQ
ncbi:unnamed protein product [Caretta caretta]